MPLFQDSRIVIVGAGGLGKEVLCCIMKHTAIREPRSIQFVEEDNYYHKRDVLGIEVVPFSEAQFAGANVFIAIGDSGARERIVSLLPPDTIYPVLIDQSVLHTPYTSIGEGTIILGHVFLSCDVGIGKFSLINPGSTISHDCKIGDFFTASPGVNISGNCRLGNHVFIGTGACLRNVTTICDDVIIGMGSVVVRDIQRKGTYIGNPARSINM